MVSGDPDETTALSGKFNGMNDRMTRKSKEALYFLSRNEVCARTDQGKLLRGRGIKAQDGIHWILITDCYFAV